MSCHLCKHTVGSIFRIICRSENKIILISFIQDIKNIIYGHAFIIIAQHAEGWVFVSQPRQT